MSASLIELLESGFALCWTLAQDDAFRKLRGMAPSFPILAFYSTDADNIISAQASSYGIGAALNSYRERRQGSLCGICIQVADHHGAALFTNREGGISDDFAL